MNLTRVTNSLVTRLIVFGVVLVIVGATARYILLSKVLRDNLIEVFSEQQISLADDAARAVDYTVSRRAANRPLHKTPPHTAGGSYQRSGRARSRPPRRQDGARRTRFSRSR